MSPVLVGIVDGDATQVPSRTRDGRSLRTVGTAPPIAVLSEDGAAGASAAALMAHEEMVSELMNARAILPARYGVTVSDEQVRALLTDQREPLLDALASVRGAVELAVRARISADAESAPRPTSGTDYLHRRLEERAERQRVERQLGPLTEYAQSQAPLRPRVAEAKDSYGPSLRFAYLVDHRAVGEFIAVVRRIDEEYPELELICTGPWPPYSFTRYCP